MGVLGRPKEIGPSRAVSDIKNFKNDYIALLDLDFSWNEKMVNRVIGYWEAGYHISEIAEKVDRVIDEVAILIIDLSRNNELTERPGGAFGDKCN